MVAGASEVRVRGRLSGDGLGKNIQQGGEFIVTSDAFVVSWSLHLEKSGSLFLPLSKRELAVQHTTCTVEQMNVQAANF